MTTESAPEMATLEIWKGPEAELRVGGLRLVACRREVDTIDGGITLYVWDDPDVGEAQELLRMDLFRERPHYHAPAEKQEETSIDASGDAVLAWGVEALTTRVPSLLAEGGFDATAIGLDAAELEGAGPAMRAMLEGLDEPKERSTFDVPASVIASLREG